MTFKGRSRGRNKHGYGHVKFILKIRNLAKEEFVHILRRQSKGFSKIQFSLGEEPSIVIGWRKKKVSPERLRAEYACARI